MGRTLPTALLGEIVGYLDITLDVFLPRYEKIWEKNSRIEKIIEDGTVKWHVNGLAHSLHDRPAVIWNDGIQEWFCRGQMHRGHDRPAQVYPNDGTKGWAKMGMIHRNGGKPAIERVFGNGCVQREWWIMDKLHREDDEPAIETTNGTKKWYWNNQLHRDGDLSAVEHPNGNKEWWIHGLRHRDHGRPAIYRLLTKNHEWCGTTGTQSPFEAKTRRVQTLTYKSNVIKTIFPWTILVKELNPLFWLLLNFIK